MATDEARARFDRGDAAGALSLLEGLRKDAATGRDAEQLRDVQAAAAELQARASGNDAKKLGQLAMIAAQNLNFLQVEFGGAAASVAATAADSDEESGPVTTRADIATALGRMSTRFGGRREIKKLSEYLWHDETVSRMATGTLASKNGLLVLTDRRLIFIYHGWTSTHNEDFPLDALTSIASNSGLVMANITAFAGGARHEIHNVSKRDAKAIVDEVRQRLATRSAAPGSAKPAPTPATPAAAQPAPGQDVLGQLKQLGELRDAGVLTQEEFESKKAELLARL